MNFYIQNLTPCFALLCFAVLILFLNLFCRKKRKSKPVPIRTSFNGGEFNSHSRPASSQQQQHSRPPSSQRPRSPAEPYNPPESPKRRGLGPHNGGPLGQKDPSESLHRLLFTNLPVMPDMPIRLEAETIINDSNVLHKEDLLERSMTVTSSVVDIAYRDGFYRDGRNNIPISERARRVYVPDMPAFQGEADRHPNLVTEEYLEGRRQRPQSQGSVLGDRSANLRAVAKKRAATANEAKSKSSLESPKRGNQEEGATFNDAFSDYYQGLLPLNGVGEVEPESEFQLFLVQKQQQKDQRASTAPTTFGPRGGAGEGRGRGRGAGSSGMVGGDDSMAFEESTTFDERSKDHGDASYASSLSHMDDHDFFLMERGSQGGDSLVSDWHEERKEVESHPPLSNKGMSSKRNSNDGGHIVQSVDMLFP